MEHHAAPYRYTSLLQWVVSSRKLQGTLLGSGNSPTVAILGSRGRASLPAAALGLRFGRQRIGHSELLAARS
jgi:hypothetical protein